MEVSEVDGYCFTCIPGARYEYVDIHTLKCLPGAAGMTWSNMILDHYELVR